MSQVLTLRVPDSTAQKLREVARRDRRSLNETGTAALEEWLRQEELSLIEFDTIAGGRYACVKGWLPVWEVILIGRAYNMDFEKTVAHWEGKRTVEGIRAAFNYYEAYPQEIDHILEENGQGFDRLKKLLPGIRLTEVETARDAG